MGIPLRHGRVITDRDASGQPGVVVVGESMAGAHLAGAEREKSEKRLMVPDARTSRITRPG
jgi:hypothetical protein